MTSSRSAAEYLAEIQSELGTVPLLSEGHSCSRCLGPTHLGYRYCTSCHSVYGQAPGSLHGRCVPMTTALDPSPWYGRLWKYKQTTTADWTRLAALVSVYHRAKCRATSRPVGRKSDRHHDRAVEERSTIRETAASPSGPGRRFARRHREAG